MNEKLVEILKQRGLFPYEINHELQEQYKKAGIDPSTLEFHYNPRTPSYIIERMQRIEKNVLKLHELEKQKIVPFQEYRTIESEIWKDLSELDHPTFEDVLSKIAEEGPRTSMGGVYRDIIISKKRLKEIDSLFGFSPFTYYFPF